MCWSFIYALNCRVFLLMRFIHLSVIRCVLLASRIVIIIIIRTYSMVQSPSWEANWFAASQEIPHISRNPKVHYHTHKRPPPVPIHNNNNNNNNKGKHLIDSLQKTAILGTSHIIRKVLQCEAWSLSGGDHRWFKRSTRKKCLWQETYILYNNNNNNIGTHILSTLFLLKLELC